MKPKEQFKESSSIKVEDFKEKDPREMAEAIIANPDAVTDEMWEVFADKINSWKKQDHQGKAYEGYFIIYRNIDAVLSGQIPDRILPMLYGNATNIVKDYEEIRKKIYEKNPKVIEKAGFTPPSWV